MKKKTKTRCNIKTKKSDKRVPLDPAERGKNALIKLKLYKKIKYKS
jgi:hypothetical protein